MDRHSLLPFFFDIDFTGPAAFSCQNDTAEPQLYYHGLAVRALSSPCPAYLTQLETDQNNAHPVSPLNGFRVASLTQAFPDDVDESDLTIMPQSIIDGKAPLTIPGSYPGNQSCSSGNDLEIRETASANRLNPDHHLTPLPAELANPQDSPPLAFISPLNLQQPASDNRANSAAIVDDKSLLPEQKKAQKREHQKIPGKNPGYTERDKMCRNTSQCFERQKRYRMRLSNDPTYLERERQRHKQYRMRLSKDPAYLERERQRSRERRKNPDYREREKNRRKTAKYKESQNRYRRKPAVMAKQKKLWKERLKDPVRGERLTELRRQRANERYRNDATYAEGRRIRCTTYNRMKKIFGKEEASKMASKAKEAYLQSVKTPEYSGNLPQNANKNSDLLPSQTE